MNYDSYTCHKIMRADQSGNVLFLILIAVALFAALSYAVTQSTRGGANDISKEEAALAASELLQYGGAIENAIERMRIINDCGENEISFENDYYPTDTANPRAPVDFSCHVFHPNGGGISYRVWPEDWMAEPTVAQASTESYRGQTAFVGSSRFDLVGIAEKAEVTMIIPWLKDDICNAINNKFDVPTGLSRSIGWFQHHLGPNDIREPPEAMNIQTDYTTGCHSYTGGWTDLVGVNTFYYIILPR